MNEIKHQIQMLDAMLKSFVLNQKARIKGRQIERRKYLVNFLSYSHSYI